METEAKATMRYLRMAPRKVRLVVDLVREKRVDDALNILTFTKKSAALPVAKLIKSAVANADHNLNMDLDRLFVKKIFVDEGPTLRRFMPRAMGRATRIRKRSSHLTVVLGER